MLWKAEKLAKFMLWKAENTIWMFGIAELKEGKKHFNKQNCKIFTIFVPLKSISNPL